MRKKHLRFEQMEVFRPMPVPDALKRQIRQEAERANKLATQAQSEPQKEPYVSSITIPA